jgi:hypothetical protein
MKNASIKIVHLFSMVLSASVSHAHFWDNGDAARNPQIKGAYEDILRVSGATSLLEEYAYPIAATSLIRNVRETNYSQSIPEFATAYGFLGGRPGFEWTALKNTESRKIGYLEACAMVLKDVVLPKNTKETRRDILKKVQNQFVQDVSGQGSVKMAARTCNMASADDCNIDSAWRHCLWPAIGIKPFA